MRKNSNLSFLNWKLQKHEHKKTGQKEIEDNQQEKDEQVSDPIRW